MHENPSNNQQKLFFCHHMTPYACRSYWCDHDATLIQSHIISTMLCLCKFADGAILSFKIVKNNSTVFRLNTFMMRLLMCQQDKISRYTTWWTIWPEYAPEIMSSGLYNAASMKGNLIYLWFNIIERIYYNFFVYTSYKKFTWNCEMFKYKSRARCHICRKFFFSNLFNIIINQHCIKEKIKKTTMASMRIRCTI